MTESNPQPKNRDREYSEPPSKQLPDASKLQGPTLEETIKTLRTDHNAFLEWQPTRTQASIADTPSEHDAAPDPQPDPEPDRRPRAQRKSTQSRKPKAPPKPIPPTYKTTKRRLPGVSPDLSAPPSLGPHAQGSRPAPPAPTNTRSKARTEAKLEEAPRSATIAKAPQAAKRSAAEGVLSHKYRLIDSHPCFSFFVFLEVEGLSRRTLYIPCCEMINFGLAGWVWEYVEDGQMKSEREKALLVQVIEAYTGRGKRTREERDISGSENDRETGNKSKASSGKSRKQLHLGEDENEPESTAQAFVNPRLRLLELNTPHPRTSRETLDLEVEWWKAQKGAQAATTGDGDDDVDEESEAGEEE